METLTSRLETFAEWPLHIPVKAREIAEAGFYYVGHGDKVCCFSCKGTICGWQAGDRPEEIHRQRFGNRCAFVRSRLMSEQATFATGVDEIDHGQMTTNNTKKNNYKQIGYDPIGDEAMEFEEQRLRSFKRNHGWPGLVSPVKLAKAGFYFTGVDDNVKCFACDLGLQMWQPNDDPMVEHVKYQPACPFLAEMSRNEARPYGDIQVQSVSNGHRIINGSKVLTVGGNNLQAYNSIEEYNHATTSVPASSFVNHHGNTTTTVTGNDVRLYQSSTNHHHTGNMLPTVTNVPTFSYSNHHGNIGGSVTANGVQPYQSPTTYQQGITATNIGMPLGTNTNNTLYNKKPNPNQPEKYANEHTRLHTFINWPKDCPIQPKELIDAGFYYTGEEDQARCFKCGITLAGWEPQDTPWGEHEKWSRDCPLVKERLFQRNPRATNVPACGASIMPKEQTWQVPQENGGASEHNVAPATGKIPGKSSSHEGHLPSEQSELSSSQDKSQQAKVSVQGKNAPIENGKKEVFFLQRAVQELVERGYDYNKIQETIQYKTKVCNESIDSLEELLDALVLFTQSNNAGQASRAGVTTEEAAVSPASGERPGFSLAVGAEDLHRQFKEIQEANTCKICLDAEIGVLFIPCGHLVCCPNCAAAIQTKSPALCPVCRKHIDSSIRTYLS